MAVIATLVLIAILIPHTTHSDISEATSISSSPIESLSETPTINEVKQAVDYIASKYGLNKEQLKYTISCESGFSYNPNGWNDGGLAYGVAQFHKSTFDSFCNGNYYSTKDQLICMGEMWSKGLQHHWSCWTNKYDTKMR